MSPMRKAALLFLEMLLAILPRQSHLRLNKSPLALYRLTLCVRPIVRACPYTANRKGAPYVHHRNRL